MAGGPDTASRTLEQDLSAFVPQDRRWALASGAVLPERSDGAALFADLSGFTKLTELLARVQGPLRGAESLSQVLRRVFEGLIGKIEREGGSVLGFSGDAVTCWFDEDDGTAAIRAGFAMQDVMAAMDEIVVADGEVVRLKLKVAVAVGSVVRYVVGDASIQQIDVIAGHTLDVLATAEHGSEPGEVVLALEGGPRVPLIEERRDEATGLSLGVVAPEAGRGRSGTDAGPPVLERDVAGRWVLPAVRRRIEEGLGAYVAGFRPAAALFLSFRGIDYGSDPEAGAKLDGFICWVQRVVDEHGGSVIQVTTGDKGSYLYAAFGAPVAHEDDAARAVAAARMLVLTPRPHVAERRVGLTHGSMFTGTYGSLDRCTYGVLGPMTNLAARLMTEAASGQVLCNVDAARLASQRFRMEERPARRVKGVAEPVAVFEPVGESVGASSLSSVLRGRREELALSVEALDRACRGEVPTVVIDSEPGLGKTRLLAAIAEEAEGMGMQVLRATVRAAGPEEPYAPWRGVVRDALGLAAGQIDASDLVNALEGLDPDLVGYASALDDVLAIGLASPAGAEGSARRQLLTAAVSLVLEARAARTRLAILFDDGQRIDELSADLLAEVTLRLRRDRAGAAFVVARRPGVGDDAVPEGATALRLAPLADSELEAMAADRLRVTPGRLPDDLKRLLRERCGGNPLVAEGLIQHLQLEGLLTVTEGPDGAECALHGTPEQLAEVPFTIQGLLLSQIDRLEPSQQLTLKVAATVGREFVIPAVTAALATVRQIDEPATRTAVDELAEHGFVDALAVLDSYRFRQGLAQEVAYETLLFAQRRELHGALASWFRTAASRDLATIAHHAFHAAVGSDDPELVGQAAEGQADFAQQLLDLGSYAGAADVVRRGLALLPDIERWAPMRARLLVMSGVVGQHLSRYDDAEADLEAGLVLARRADAARTVAQALDGLCLVATRRGAYDEARRFAEEGLVHVLACADHASEARARSRLGILAAYGGAFDEAVGHHRKAIALAEEVGDRASEASSLNNLGVAHLYQQEYASARQAFARALDIAEELQSRHLRARFVTNLGLVDEHLGQLESAEAHYRGGLALFEELGARQEAIVNVLNLGEVAVRRGRLDQARVSYRRALADGLAMGALPVALSAVGGLAWAAVRDGDPAVAAELVGVALGHPARDSEVEQHAEMVLSEVRAVLSEDAVAAGLTRGRATTLEDVARRMSAS